MGKVLTKARCNLRLYVWLWYLPSDLLHCRWWSQYSAQPACSSTCGQGSPSCRTCLLLIRTVALQGSAQPGHALHSLTTQDTARKEDRTGWGHIREEMKANTSMTLWLCPLPCLLLKKHVVKVRQIKYIGIQYIYKQYIYELQTNHMSDTEMNKPTSRRNSITFAPNWVLKSLYVSSDVKNR